MKEMDNQQQKLKGPEVKEEKPIDDNAKTVVDNRKETYGEKYNEHLLEQYILYVGGADKISDRRSQMNVFYVSLLSALIALISFVFTTDTSWFYLTMLFSVSILGVSLCTIWRYNIRSYAQLNTGKFAVIHEMEKLLPYSCYAREWVFLGEGKDEKKYKPFTEIETFVPIVLAFPYFLLMVYSLYHLYGLIW